MKIPIFIIFLLTLTSSSPLTSSFSDQTTWFTSCFDRPTTQKEETWCVHACMEMTFGIPQCVSVHNWISFRDGIVIPNVDCCDVVIPPHKFYPCIKNAGVPRYEILHFLSQKYAPIQGQLTTLWDLLSYGQDVNVAFLSLHNSRCYHLAVLYGVKKVSDTFYEITYCDPDSGILSTIGNPNPLEIIF